jgi:exopolysaccharide production protein ExoF
MYHDLMREAAQNDPTVARDPSNENAVQVSYSIVRETDGKSSEIQADENTAVLPGDVVKVRIALPSPTSN